MSELSVLVLPLIRGSHGLDRVPMFDDLAVREPEEIVESGVDAVAGAFADRQNEGAFRKDSMEALGIPRKTLYDKMKKYGLDKSQYK